MSFDYSLEARFLIGFSEENLMLIFEVGLACGFTYQIFEDEGWNGIPREGKLSTKRAVHKVIDYLDDESKQEYGPMVWVIYAKDKSEPQSLFMTIRRTTTGNITIEWNCLDQTRIRFADGEEGVDFPYFINKFIDLYGQFNMISLEATYF